MDAAERYLADQVLVGIVLNDLAKVHDIPVSVLEKEFVEHHAYDWYRNELAVGELLALCWRNGARELITIW